MEHLIDETVRRLKAEDMALLESLVSTPAATFEAYRQRVGEILGIRRSMEVLIRTMRGTDDY